MLGRFAEADESLARVFQTIPANIEPLHQGIPHFCAVELAWFRDDPNSAMWHANEVARYGSQAANPYWSALTSFCYGQAASTGGDFEKADGFFREALKTARESRAGLEFEARILATRADNLNRAGDPRLAGQVAAEAISVARRKADRLAECLASLVAARVCLSQAGSRRPPMARTLLDRAKTLVDLTGAVVFRPMMARIAN